MTPAESEAQRITRDFIRQYDPLQIHHGPLPAGSLARGGMCMRDGSSVSFEFLEGDFALDDPLAIAYLRSVMPGRAASGAPGQAGNATPEWMQQWKAATDPSGNAGSVERLWGEFIGATAGPGNALGNLAGPAEIGTRAVKKALTQAQIERAAALLAESGAKGVQVNPNVRIYDANAVARQKMRAKGQTPSRNLTAPRLRIQITGVSTKVIQLGGMGVGGSVHGGTGYSAAGASRAAAIASNQWAARSALSFLKAPGVPAALAFAPSAIIDAADAYEYAAGGAGSLNWRKFAASSAKSQSANAVGLTAGILAPTVALGVVGLFGLTIGTGGVILIALAGGIIAQAVLNGYGFGEMAEDAAKNLLAK